MLLFFLMRPPSALLRKLWPLTASWSGRLVLRSMLQGWSADVSSPIIGPPSSVLASSNVIRSKLAQSDELSHVLDDLEIGHVNVFGGRLQRRQTKRKFNRLALMRKKSCGCICGHNRPVCENRGSTKKSIALSLKRSRNQSAYWQIERRETKCQTPHCLRTTNSPRPWLRIPSADGATAAKVVFGACGNMGNVSSAARTAYYSALHTPSLIIFAGIAGSLDPSKMRLGDVMGAEEDRCAVLR